MSLIANRVTEKDLREWLERGEHYGSSARISELELVAIQKPGWVQIFRFRAMAKHKTSETWEELCGLIRDDERKGCEVRLASSEEELYELFNQVSDGMLVTQRSELGILPTAFVMIGLFLVLLAGTVAVLSGGQ
ncbi:hypothetical protein [Calycomorphotria hydatis]|uniref:Uncharacterized protein n=1 Tax=Calycomorphotria hydatis TaxID=2528027 RepID=A0A517TBG4_9PLAN|nr:hypothetical protein [Calycomorphotria hydatis]QDT65714.1 hypothetical protein V22_29740 [Calycomorphotria hydatis]